MQDQLNRGYSKHDFSSIQACIIKHFPVEEPGKYNADNIQEFSGWQAISELMNENFYVAKKFNARWGRFKKYLRKELKMPVEETLNAFFPCYSGKVNLKTETHGVLTYKKDLYFFISISGPFYTVFGIGSCEVLLSTSPHSDGKGEIYNHRYAAFNALTVSPYLEYEAPFLLLRNKIAVHFTDMQFVPFAISKLKVNGISVIIPSTDAALDNSVFSALFSSENYFNIRVRGDMRYGLDEWLKVKKPDAQRIKEPSISKYSIDNGLLNLEGRDEICAGTLQN